MPSMYETIRGLPLFQGTSTEQISDFLSRTKVEFVNFKAEDRIAESGDKCVTLKFIISGTIKSYMSIAGGKVALCSYLGPGSVLDAMYLFGMYTYSHEDIICATPGSYMSIPKSEYFALLRTAPIYLLNYLNYLSYNAQRARRGLCAYCGGGLRMWLECLRTGVLDKQVQKFEMRSTMENLASIFGQNKVETRQILDEMASNGELSYEGDILIKL